MPASTCCRRVMVSIFVVEVNGIPGWRGLQQATGCDVAGAVVQHLLNRMETGHAPGGLVGMPV